LPFDSKTNSQQLIGSEISYVTRSQLDFDLHDEYNGENPTQTFSSSKLIIILLLRYQYIVYWFIILIIVSDTRDIFYQNVTVFEIATFVADYSKILSLASTIYKSKQINWNQSFQIPLSEDQSTKRDEIKLSLEVCIMHFQICF
jgi:hypothetical protein